MSKNFVDVKWLSEEATAMASSFTPKFPLVVGGAGLIGCNLVVLLAKSSGCERIRVLDVVPPRPQVLQEAGIDDKKVEFMKHRIGTDSDDGLDAAVKDIDTAFFTVTPHVQMATRADFFKTNVDGVLSLLKALEKARVKHLVFLSSIAVSNHFVNSRNQNEEYPLPALESYESPYDITKRRGEDAVLAANRAGGMKTCALRPGGVLLSPTDFTMRNLFIVRRLIAKPTGTEKIDFIDGRDVARGMLLASQALAEGKRGVAGEAFWLTKGESWFAGDIAVLAAKTLGWCLLPVPACITKMAACFAMLYYKVRCCLGLRVPGIPPHRFMHMAFVEQTFDNSKVERVLGFKPKVPISDAVIRICELHR